MLSYFPARDLDEPVTKEFLRAELADLRLAMYSQFSGVQGQIGKLRDDVHAQFGNARDDLHTEICEVQAEVSKLRDDMHAQIGNARDDLHTEISGVQAEVSKLRDDMHIAMQRMLIWTISTMIALAGVIAGIGFAVR